MRAVRAAIVSTLGEWATQRGDPLEKSWIAHGPALLATIGGELYQTRYMTPQALQVYLADEDYDLVGVSATSATYPLAKEILQWLQKMRCKTAIGGVHASLQPDDYADAADYIVQGHGELAWKTLLEGEQLAGLSRHDIEDLDELPFIDRSKWNREVEWLGLPGPYGTFLAARGCPYRCEFCWPSEEIHFGKKLRRRSVGNLVSELKEVKEKYGIRGAQIHDDTFTYDRKWVEEFCEKVPSLDIKFFVATRADHVCKWPEMYPPLLDAGVEVISVGFESGNQRILDLMRKGTTVEQNIEAGRKLKEMGFRIFSNYMFGVPTETLEEMVDTVNMIRAIQPHYHSTSMFSPYPGSAMGDKAMKDGLVTCNVWRRDPTRPYIKGHDVQQIQLLMSAARAQTTEPLRI